MWLLLAWRNLIQRLHIPSRSTSAHPFTYCLSVEKTAVNLKHTMGVLRIRTNHPQSLEQARISFQTCSIDVSNAEAKTS